MLQRAQFWKQGLHRAQVLFDRPQKPLELYGAFIASHIHISKC